MAATDTTAPAEPQANAVTRQTPESPEADDMGDSLVPDPEDTAGVGGARAAVPSGSRYRCYGSDGFVKIRNVPRGYVIGTCENGTGADVARCNDNDNCVMQLGYTYGIVQGCGWIYATNFGSRVQAATRTCSFGYSNTTIGRSESGGDWDGVRVMLKPGVQTCSVYTNARPWTGAADGIGQRLYPVKNASGIYWRYKTSGAGEWVMARIQNNLPGEPKWVFLRRSCLPDGPLPQERAMTD